jgi:tetratricopeptide (TPR) repeat protein
MVWLSIRAILASLAISACILWTVEAQTGREVAQSAFRSVVVLVAENAKSKPISLGSGFFVRTDVIATNYHVIKGASRLYAKLVGQQGVYRIKEVLTIDKDRDLALLKVAEVTAPVLSLGYNREVAIGDEVFVVGNPEGLEGTFSQGVISGIRSVAGKLYLQITAPISPGSSGGPVMNTSGEVIGVAVGTLRTGQNLNFAVPVSDLRFLLTRTFADGDANEPDEPRRTSSATFNETYKPYTNALIEKEIYDHQQQVRLSPKSATTNFELAETYRRWGRKTEAVQAYNQAIRLKSDYAQAYYGLAKSLMLNLFLDSNGSEKQSKIAVETFKHAIRINPDYAEAHLGLGEAYANLNRNDEAIDAFKVALAVNPEFSEAYMQLGLLYKRIGQYPNAIIAFTEHIRTVRFPSVSARGFAEMGEIYTKLGEYDKAIKSYNEALNAQPFADVANEHFGLWAAYKASGRLSEGVENFKQLVSRLESTIESSKSTDEFMRDQKMGQLLWAHRSLGMMYVYLGDKALALEQYKALKSLGDGAFANRLFDAIYK